MEERFNVKGKVQGVFFRKSFVYLLKQRGLQGGATNSATHKDIVHCSVKGNEQDCQKLKEDLIEAQKFNSMGALVTDLIEVDHGIEITDHQANTIKEASLNLPFGVKVFI